MHNHLRIRLGASAACLLLAGAAQAQTSVSIYGRINVTMESQRNGDAGSAVHMVDNASRIGFKGREDLGGGMYAAFKLESGFNAASGESYAFQRESSVELGSTWGAVRMGNWIAGSYAATADFVSLHNHDTGRSSDALYAFSSYAQQRRVAYLTPSLHGLTAELSTTTEPAGQPRTTDLSANWQGGPWMLGAGYSKRDQARQWALRALWNGGAWMAGGYFQRETVDGSPHGDTRNIYRAVAMYAVGAGEFHANAGYSGRGGSFATKATQYTLGYNHNLSKRTKVYTFYTAINRPGRTDDLRSVAVGVRHAF